VVPANPGLDAKRRIAENVPARRKELDWPQEAADQACGMATRHFQKLEAAELNVTINTLAKIATAFKLELSELIR
jgi:hypothetical protein